MTNNALQKFDKIQTEMVNYFNSLKVPFYETEKFKQFEENILNHSYYTYYNNENLKLLLLNCNIFEKNLFFSLIYYKNNIRSFSKKITHNTNFDYLYNKMTMISTLKFYEETSHLKKLNNYSNYLFPNLKNELYKLKKEKNIKEILNFKLEDNTLHFNLVKNKLKDIKFSNDLTIKFLKKIPKDFCNTKKLYFDFIMSKTKINKSLLKNFLINRYGFFNIADKFEICYIDLYVLKKELLIRNIPVYFSVLDNRESDYELFMLDYSIQIKKPNNSLHQVMYLKSCLIYSKIMYKQTKNEKYKKFIKQLTEHLKKDCFKENLEKLEESFKNYKKYY